ncbi:MAG: ribonucleotide reductase N-terminal alpha domain-containing protein, partial [Priestia megaterium]
MVNTLKPTILHELTAYIERLKKEFTQLDFSLYEEKVIQTVTVKENMTDEKVANVLILAALERISMEEPDWTYVAADVYLNELYRKAADNRGYDKKEKYGSFYQLIQELTKIGIYNKQLLKTYTEEEINEIASVIIPERDRLFTYIGLLTLADRYLATSHDKRVYELPQERFLIIAMTLMSQEKKENRTALVKEAYWALSSLYMTVATPTLSNAGKSYGQLSSCFIDTIDDSLRGIYDSNTDLATLSKNGGGIGVYLGHIRSRGSDIKGFKGVSSGTIPWMKQLNNTA